MIGRIARGTLARMGNVERCDNTLALNEMIFYVRRDARLRARRRLVHGHRHGRVAVRGEPRSGGEPSPSMIEIVRL